MADKTIYGTSKANMKRYECHTMKVKVKTEIGILNPFNKGHLMTLYKTAVKTFLCRLFKSIVFLIFYFSKSLKTFSLKGKKTEEG